MKRYNYQNSCKKPLKIVYILLYFPHLTETFIANEIQAVQSLGNQVKIVSLLQPKKTPVQPLSKKLLKNTIYASSLLNPTLWKAQFYFVLLNFKIYFSLLFTLLLQPSNRSIILFTKRIVIFLKSVTIAYLFKDTEIDLFHSHFAWLSSIGAWICSRLLNRPFTVTLHAFDIYSKTDLLDLIATQASHLVSISYYNSNYITGLGKCSPESISVIHCGLDLSKFNFNLKHLSTDLNKKPLGILSVGSLTTKKGHIDLIEACRLLREKGIKYKCEIIGDGKDKSDLNNQIISNGLEKQIHLKGPLTSPEVRNAYAQNDIFVLASVIAPSGDRDGIPVVMMEAAAMGLPIISTNISGIPELIHHKETGLLVQPNNPEALAEAISELLSNDVLRKRLCKNARKLIEKEFNQRINAKRLIKLFHGVVAKQTGE